MRTWYVYLIRPRLRGGPLVRAYATLDGPPAGWWRRAKYLGSVPAPTRRMAEVLAVVLGWKREGRLPRLEAG